MFVVLTFPYMASNWLLMPLLSPPRVLFALASDPVADCADSNSAPHSRGEGDPRPVPCSSATGRKERTRARKTRLSLPGRGTEPPYNQDLSSPPSRWPTGFAGSELPPGPGHPVIRPPRAGTRTRAGSGVCVRRAPRFPLVTHSETPGGHSPAVGARKGRTPSPLPLGQNTRQRKADRKQRTPLVLSPPTPERGPRPDAGPGDPCLVRSGYDSCSRRRAPGCPRRPHAPGATGRARRWPWTPRNGPR